MTDFLAKADKAAEQAEQAGSIVFSNFGRLQIELSSYKVWKQLPDDKWTAEEVTEDVYNVTADNMKFMEINFTVMISEMNHELEWEYTRRVSITKGKSDWHQIVRPSIDEVFGKGVPLSSINGKYVEVQDVPQVKGDDYKTIKFVRTFDSREACKAAYDEYQSQFKKNAVAQPAQQAVGGLNTHPFDMKQWMEYIVPNVKDELAKGSSHATISSSYGITEDQVKRIAENGL